MRYANEEHTVIDVGDGRFIPTDPRNPDFRRIAGDKIDAYVPDPVAIANARREKIKDRLVTAIAAGDDALAAQIKLEYQAVTDTVPAVPGN